MRSKIYIGLAFFASWVAFYVVTVPVILPTPVKAGIFTLNTTPTPSSTPTVTATATPTP